MHFVQNTVVMMRSYLMLALMICGVVAYGQHDTHTVHETASKDTASAVNVSHEEVAQEEEKFNPGAMIMHHISDAHQIHFIGKIYMPLPVILWNHGHLEVFMSSAFWNGFDEKGELQFKPYTASSGTTYENHHESIVVSSGESHEGHGAHAEHGAEVAHEKPMDFSITKSVFGMLFIIVLMVIIFRSVAARYKEGANKAPTGLQNAIEPFILFVRDEVAIPSIGKKKAASFMPFLLTVFFFIWMCNMLGLIPFLGGFNITGTLSITLVLATLVFIITSINGNAHYWGHIFWPPGIPFGIKLILVPIEALSIFIKPTVLMIRLTANITAGHIIILAFVGLVLLFGQNSAIAGYGVGVGAVLFMIFMFFIELLVAFLQAYVFTLLAALYFGDATQEHHHEEDHH
ncbi:MAG: F0F1 ATP synthase subunit A [Bacteroidetes bacterium]|nr:F0F1 ATP synthase subunit A [Bacteroidota bacterium]